MGLRGAAAAFQAGGSLGDVLGAEFKNCPSADLEAFTGAENHFLPQLGQFNPAKAIQWRELEQHGLWDRRRLLEPQIGVEFGFLGADLAFLAKNNILASS